MSALKRLLQRFSLAVSAKRHTVQVRDELLPTLEALAESDRRSVDQVANRLLSDAIDERREAAKLEQTWARLTEREQQVVALTCLGYTNPQISQHIGISTNTVKVHIRRALGKFDLSSKAALRQVMASWDFSSWV